MDAYPSRSTAKRSAAAPVTTGVKPRAGWPRSGWRAVPAVPKFLGLTGLIPFYVLCPPLIQTAAAAAASVEVLEPLAEPLMQNLYPIAVPLQIGYGTAIVSFLGAVHWGSAMQSRSGHTTKLMFERYVWSVMPALVAFPAAGAGDKAGAAVIFCALMATFAIDAKFNWKGALPKWYMALRVPLTAGAATAMFLTLWHVHAEDEAVHHDPGAPQAVTMA